MAIALAGVTGVRNRGVQALVDTTLSQIEQRWPGQRRTVLSSDAEYDRVALASAAEVMSDGARFFSLRKPLRAPLAAALEARAWLRGQPGVMLQARKAIESADIVIMSGGDIFGSDYGTGFLRQQIATVEFAQSLGKSTVFLAHSIGPFAHPDEVSLMRPALERSSLITVRESLTRAYLVETFGLAPERVVLTADVAFLMQPSDAARTDAIQAMLGLPKDTGFVAMAPSEGITNFSSMQDARAHDAAWVAAIRFVLANTSDSVLLIPHVQDHRAENDDSRIAFRLLETLKFDPRVRAAMGPFSARDYKALIARSRFLIGERMHACIAGLSSCVPVLTVGYSVKAQGIMGEIFGPDAARLGLVVPVTKFIAPGTVDTLIAGLEGNLDAVGAILKKNIPAVVDRARENFTLMAPLFEK